MAGRGGVLPRSATNLILTLSLGAGCALLGRGAFAQNSDSSDTQPTQPPQSRSAAIRQMMQQEAARRNAARQGATPLRMRPPRLNLRQHLRHLCETAPTPQAPVPPTQAPVPQNQVPTTPNAGSCDSCRHCARRTGNALHLAGAGIGEERKDRTTTRPAALLRLSTAARSRRRFRP